MPIALSLLLVSQAALIDAQPELARITDLGATPVILRGHLSKRRAQKMERYAREVYRDLARRFLRESNTKHAPVQVCLFDSDRAYHAFARAIQDDRSYSSWGFYLPSKRLVIANLAQSVGNLRHELAHPLLGDDYPDIPAWLNEGIASLYGNVQRRRGGLRFTVNYRLRHLREAKAQGRLPGLSALANSGRAQLYGAEAMTYYALSRYVLLYLDRRDQLSALYKQLRDGPKSRKAHLRALRARIDEARFIRWTTRLKRNS